MFVQFAIRKEWGTKRTKRKKSIFPIQVSSSNNNTNHHFYPPININISQPPTQICQKFLHITSSSSKNKRNGMKRNFISLAKLDIWVGGWEWDKVASKPSKRKIGQVGKQLEKWKWVTWCEDLKNTYHIISKRINYYTVLLHKHK